MIISILLFVFFNLSSISWGDEGGHNQIINNTLDQLENQPLSRPANSSDLPADSSEPVIDALDFRDIEILEVLKQIALQTGWEIIPAENLTGLVTISAKNINARDALRAILSPRGLAYLQNGHQMTVVSKEFYIAQTGIPFDEVRQAKMITLQYIKQSTAKEILMSVKSPSGKIYEANEGNGLILIDVPETMSAMTLLIEDFDVPIETEVFQLQYVRPAKAARSIEEVLSKNIGHVQADERSNNVIVTDNAEKMKKIRELIKEIDQEENKLIVELKIVQITLNEEHVDGVDWEAIVSNFQPIYFPSQDPKEDNQRLSLGTLTQEDYEVLLDALDTVGVINSTTNLQIALDANKISEVMIKSTDFSHLDKDQSHEENPPTINIAKVYLTAVPNGRGFYDMRLKTAILDAQATQVGDEVNMSMSNGLTIILGGLHKEFTVESLKKIPLLGDLPFLGFAFRKHGEHVSKTELIVFLTPKLTPKK